MVRATEAGFLYRTTFAKKFWKNNYCLDKNLP
jgi:hypothetical protein